MYREEAHSYLYNPFGIFGQPSVNTVLLGSLFLFSEYFRNKFNLNKRFNYKLIVILVAAIVLQGSGSGFMSLIFIVIALTWNKTRKFILPFLAILFVVLYYLIMSDKIPKLNITYINFLIDFFELIIEDYKSGLHGISEFLFGINADNPITIDFGPLYLVSKVGLVFFILYTAVLACLFVKEKSILFRVSIINIALGNLHYPTMFYVVMHFLWILVYYIVFCSKKVELTILNLKGR